MYFVRFFKNTLSVKRSRRICRQTENDDDIMKNNNKPKSLLTRRLDDSVIPSSTRNSIDTSTSSCLSLRSTMTAREEREMSQQRGIQILNEMGRTSTAALRRYRGDMLLKDCDTGDDDGVRVLPPLSTCAAAAAAASPCRSSSFRRRFPIMDVVAASISDDGCATTTSSER
jgi:hypothetical protein